MDKKSDISKFLNSKIQTLMKNKKASGIKFEDNEDLIGADVLDSFAFIELISSIEEKYEINIDFSEIDPDEFSSINGLETYIRRQLSK